MTVKHYNKYPRDIEWGEIANEWAEVARENRTSRQRKSHRQRRLPRWNTSTERRLSSIFPHFPTILITLLLLSSALPEVLKAEHALVISVLLSLILKNV